MSEEDLSDSPFLKTLAKTFPELYQRCFSQVFEANMQGLTVLIPQFSTITESTLNEDYFLTHLLLPTADDSPDRQTLNGKSLCLENQKIVTQDGFDGRTASVLFEEVFYSKGQNFNAMCIESPLIGAISSRSRRQPGLDFPPGRTADGLPPPT